MRPTGLNARRRAGKVAGPRAATRRSRPPHADLPRLRLPVPVHRRAAPSAGTATSPSGSPPTATRSPTSRCASGTRGERADDPGRARRRRRAAHGALPRRRASAAIAAAARVRRRACSGTCCATAAATTSCTPRRSRTSRCSPRRSRAARTASGSSSTGTRCGRARYWREYLGGVGGRDRLGGPGASACACRQRAFCFAAADRRRGCATEGCAATSTVLEGEYAGALDAGRRRCPPSRSWCSPAATSRRSARRRVVPAVALARERDARTCAARVFGDGPERAAVLAAIARARRSATSSRRPGFVATERGRARRCARALCLVLPSRREGYGLVVVEAAARGHADASSSRGADNAATELVEEGVNGFVAAERRARGPRRARSCASTRPARRCAQSTARLVRRATRSGSRSTRSLDARRGELRALGSARS